MATITAQQIIDRAEITLMDETNVRWNETELLEYLNDGQREIVMLKPSAYSKNTNIQCVAGTKQALPADGVILLKVIRNMGTGGTTPGRAVTRVDMDTLDHTRPNWHAEADSATSQHYMFNPQDPKTFYVTPPQPAVSQGYLEIVYSAAPADAVIGNPITLDDIYETAIYYYILFRAHSKESQEADKGKAVAYYKLFSQAIGAKTAVEVAVDQEAG